MIAAPALDASANFAAHILQPAARSLAFAAVAGMALAAFRVRNIALRLTIWRTVLVVALAMPLLGLLLPPLPVFVPLAERLSRPQPPAQIAVSPEHSTGGITVNQVARSNSRNSGTRTFGAFSYSLQSSEEASAPASSQSAKTPRAYSQTSRPFPWLAAAAALYFAVALFMLMRLALGVIFGRRLERESQRIEDPHALARLNFFARSAALSEPPRLAESDLLSVPVTFGVRRPAILLPAGWRDWDSAELDAVLAHEISHVVRRDALTERLSLLHRAIFWFSPLSWWLARQLADLAEEASDDAALSAGADRTRYAETLLGFFAALEAAPGRVWWQGVSMATAGQAEKRVDRILEWKGSVAMRLKKPAVIAYLALAIPVVCLVAAFRPTIVNIHSQPSQQAAPQTTQPPAALPAPSAQQSAAPAPATAPLPAATPAPAAPPTTATAEAEAQVPPVAGEPAPIVHVFPQISVRVPPTVVSVAPVVSVHPYVHVPAMQVSVPSMSVQVHPFVEPVIVVHPLAAYAPRPGANNTIISGFGDDQQFVIVSGNAHVSVSSNSFSVGTGNNDSGFVDSLRHNISGDFIWFLHDGKAYLIRDQATIQRAMHLFVTVQDLGRQQEALGKQQEALGAQQEALGAKQEKLGEQMEKVRVKIPDMTAELQKLEAELKKMTDGGTQEDLGRIQEKIGEIQDRIGELQSQAGEQQSELGEKQGALGEEQGKLGEQQGELGEQQGKLGEQQEEESQKASQQMKQLLDEAVAKGLAKPV
jgi:beta-lactamase regulating signal transducer with metallopeptidase domain